MYAVCTNLEVIKLLKTLIVVFPAPQGATSDMEQPETNYVFLRIEKYACINISKPV
jgi:hypothetical protein